MKHLVAPLLLLTIIADAWFWWHYDMVTTDIFWTGETLIYLCWTATFLIYVKYPSTGYEQKLLILILWSWIPFCINAVYRQQTGHGSEKSPWDLYSGFASLAFVIGQIIVWWYKAKRNDRPAH